MTLQQIEHNQSKPWSFRDPATKIAHSRSSGSNPKKASNECLYVSEPSLNETRALWSVYSFLMLPFMKTTAAPAAHWCHWGSSRTVDSAFKHFFFFFLDTIEGTKSNLVFEGMILSFSIAIVPLTSNLETVASLFWRWNIWPHKPFAEAEWLNVLFWGEVVVLRLVELAHDHEVVSSIPATSKEGEYIIIDLFGVGALRKRKGKMQPFLFCFYRL